MRGGRVELDTAAEARGGDMPQDDMRISNGRRNAAAPEGRRSRLCARAAWAHAKCSAIIDPGDAATAGGNGLHEHAGQRDGNSRDSSTRLDERLTIENESDVGAGAADVDRECIREACSAQDGCCADDPSSWSRKRERCGAASGLLDGAHAASGSHDTRCRYAERIRASG